VLITSGSTQSCIRWLCRIGTRGVSPGHWATIELGADTNDKKDMKDETDKSEKDDKDDDSD
jgi:hypothetical protein